MRLPLLLVRRPAAKAEFARARGPARACCNSATPTVVAGPARHLYNDRKNGNSDARRIQKPFIEAEAYVRQKRRFFQQPAPVADIALERGTCRIVRAGVEFGGRAPADIDPNAPLYGEGLGSSIPSTSWKSRLIVSKQYGRATSRRMPRKINKSLGRSGHLAEYIAAQRTKWSRRWDRRLQWGLRPAPPSRPTPDYPTTATPWPAFRGFGRRPGAGSNRRGRDDDPCMAHCAAGGSQR